jgi:para-nitrobenzyl esterase
MTRYLPPDANVAWRPLGAVVDQEWVPELPAHYLSTQHGDLAGVDIVLGFATDEWQFFRGHSHTIREGTRDDVLAVLRQVFGDAAASVFDRYQSIHPDHAPGHLLSDVMSFEFFKMSVLEIAQNLARQQSPAWVFQFAWELPGLGGALRAVHTGDMPFIWSNCTAQDLARWPIFDGIDRARLAGAARAFSDLYGRFVRTGDPGPAWRPFDTESRNILWLGETLDNRRRSLDSELEVFHSTGVPTIAALEDALTASLRASLSG